MTISKLVHQFAHNVRREIDGLHDNFSRSSFARNAPRAIGEKFARFYSVPAGFAKKALASAGNQIQLMKFRYHMGISSSSNPAKSPFFTSNAIEPEATPAEPQTTS